MTVPRATYRLQFRNGFDFAAAMEVVPYLARLGVSHVYASPVFQAVPGSTHGYDVTDLNSVEPELGGMGGLRDLAKRLETFGLGLIVDFVPNHMAACWENAWWREALAKGPAGPCGLTFDIDWDRADGRVVLPVLGENLDEIVARGEIKLVHDSDGYTLNYYDRRLPLNAESIVALGTGKPDAFVAAVNGDHGALLRLLDAQFYCLVDWREGPRRVNYRRFFEIDDLAALRMDRPEVFEAGHILLFRLIEEDIVDGVRLDHIDGLADPAGYLQQLREGIDRVARERHVPVWAEKILTRGERLRPEWPVAGTTGYEFAGDLVRLQVKETGQASLTRRYRKFVQDDSEFETLAAEAKRELLAESFPGEFRALVTLALELAGHPEGDAELAEGMQLALREVLAAFPVYRSYLAGESVSETDRALIDAAGDVAGPRLGAAGARGIAVLKSLVRHAERRIFFARFEQLSTALTAKAIEDTAFYRYVPLLALNEVGNVPDAAILSQTGFHEANAERRREWPLSLLATASHDTKRGEDVRARLSVLSEVPELFPGTVMHCWPDGHVAGVRAKDAWVIYQTLIGMWPPTLEPDNREGLDELSGRLQAYVVKAAREAKERSSWTETDTGYEKALLQFVRGILASEDGKRLVALHGITRQIGPAGIINSLAQLLLKLTSPGVPDVYQGTEYWDLSLVDPDNRRPVDFGLRAETLQQHAGTPLPELSETWRNGCIKQALIARVLGLRSAKPELFAEGDYRGIEPDGRAAQHIVAFARSLGKQALVVAVVRHPYRLLRADSLDMHAARLAGTLLPLPGLLPDVPMRDVLSGEFVHRGATIDCRALFSRLPVALLVADET